MKLIDIAVNLTDAMFQGVYHGKQVHASDFHRVLDRALQSGVEKMMVTGTSLSDSRQAIELAQSHRNLYATVGCHPTRCSECVQDPDGYFLSLRQLILEHRAQVVAVGECGLDYDRLEFCDKRTQQIYFRRQLLLAAELDMPLFLHLRNAASDFIDIMREHGQLTGKQPKGVVHSFDGSMDTMRVLTEELGLFIGLNGCSMKKEENLQVIRDLPLERMVLETDAPWCDVRPTHASYPYATPSSWTVPVQKKKERFVDGDMVKARNEPCMMRTLLSIVANLRGTPEERLAEIVYENTLRIFPGLQL